MSRPRPSTVGQFGVATWSRLPGRVATSARPACTRPELAVRATSRLCTQQRPRLGHYSRSVCATWFLGVRTVPQPSFGTVHCLGSLFGYCSWALFMSTVHRVKKNLKIFLCMI